MAAGFPIIMISSRLCLHCYSVDADLCSHSRLSVLTHIMAVALFPDPHVHFTLCETCREPGDKAIMQGSVVMLIT